MYVKHGALNGKGGYRFKEIKFFPMKVLNTLENGFDRS